MLAGRYLAMGGAAVALLLAGAVAGAVWTERRAATRVAVKPAEPPPDTSKADETLEVVLTPEAMARAGIKTVEVSTQAVSAVITAPATVTSNAYRETKVNALVGGVVRQVSVELGAPTRRGQPLAVIFSAELADAQMKYLSMRAMLEADHQKRERTRKLVELGAASRQELEEITATHVAHETEVAAARQRLLLLGLSAERVQKLEEPSQVVSEVIVAAPGDGVIVSRSVNPGQVVNAGQELFIVTDLSTVWVIADLYERDFARVRVGSTATITGPSAGVALQGRVSYIDPRVDPATRTAKVRVEAPNRAGDLRLGMFVSVALQTAPADRATVVPRSAIQALGERTVVYVPVAGEEGKFVERAVKLGTATGDLVQVLEGLEAGERVVTEGSFFLRAEATRSRSGG